MLYLPCIGKDVIHDQSLIIKKLLFTAIVLSSRSQTTSHRKKKRWNTNKMQATKHQMIFNFRLTTVLLVLIIGERATRALNIQPISDSWSIFESYSHQVTFIRKSEFKKTKSDETYLGSIQQVNLTVFWCFSFWNTLIRINGNRVADGNKNWFIHSQTWNGTFKWTIKAMFCFTSNRKIAEPK